MILKRVVISFIFIWLCTSLKSRTVAISYFDNTSGNVKYNALSKGIADMLITDFSKVPGITIVEREKLEKLIGEIKLNQSKYFDQSTAQKLGQGLGAQTILTGAFFILDNTIRIDARLIDVETGGVIVAEEVTGSQSNFFSLHKQLVSILSKGLKVQYNPDKTEIFDTKKDVELTAVINYSNAINYQDQGLTGEAKKILEETTTTYPSFLVAKSKLEEVKQRIKEIDIQREKLLKEQIKEQINQVNIQASDLGIKLTNIWSSLISSYNYSQLLEFNEELIKMGIKPELKLYGENSPITAGEMMGMYDVLALNSLKRLEDVVEAGGKYIEKYATSMYYTSVKMQLEQAIEELEARERGKKNVQSLIALTEVSETADFFDDLDWDYIFHKLDKRQYERLSSVYTVNILSRKKEEILVHQEEVSFDEMTSFYPMALYFEDTTFMKKIVDFGLEVYEGTDDESEGYDLQTDYIEDIYKIRENQKKIIEVREKIKAEKKQEIEDLVKWGFSKREMDNQLDLVIELCELYIKKYPPATEKELDITIDAWEDLIEALADKGKVKEAEETLEKFKKANEKTPFEPKEFTTTFSQLKSAIKTAEQQTKNFHRLISDDKLSCGILTENAQKYKDAHQYIDEINTRYAALKTCTFLNSEIESSQIMLIALAYTNIGYFDEARKVTKNLMETYPNDSSTKALETTMKFWPK
jgi:TolB-like protein/cell division FtsZ-interacting protein ZapD